MNNLFIDLVSENSIKRKNYIDEILLKTIGFIFKEDKLLKTKNTATMFLIFNMEVFLKTNRNLNILKKVLKKRIKLKRNLTIVFCKQFNTLPLIKKELLDCVEDCLLDPELPDNLLETLTNQIDAFFYK